MRIMYSNVVLQDAALSRLRKRGWHELILECDQDRENNRTWDGIELVYDCWERMRDAGPIPKEYMTGEVNSEVVTEVATPNLTNDDAIKDERSATSEQAEENAVHGEEGISGDPSEPTASETVEGSVREDDDAEDAQMTPNKKAKNKNKNKNRNRKLRKKEEKDK